MDPLAILLAVSLPVIPPHAGEFDLNASMRGAQVSLQSPELNAQVLAAMAWPYKYGVTQIPCAAKAMQPKRGWKAAREPSGRIQWVQGPVKKAFWAGMYGTCLIQAPRPREQVREAERVALECECNGWLPDR